MDHGVSKVEKKGVTTVLFQKPDGFVSVKPSQAGHFVGSSNLLVVLMKSHTPVVICAESAVEIFEALCVGHSFGNRRAVGYVPFADAPRRIAGIFQQLSHRDLASRH